MCAFYCRAGLNGASTPQRKCKIRVLANGRYVCIHLDLPVANEVPRLPFRYYFAWFCYRQLWLKLAFLLGRSVAVNLRNETVVSTLVCEQTVCLSRLICNGTRGLLNLMWNYDKLNSAQLLHLLIIKWVGATCRVYVLFERNRFAPSRARIALSDCRSVIVEVIDGITQGWRTYLLSRATLSVTAE